jgi:hypothetical protein
VDLGSSSTEPGLNQIQSADPPMRCFAMRDINMQKDKSADVVKRPVYASAPRCARVHSDRFKNELGQ